MRAYETDERYGQDDVVAEGETGERTVDNEVGLILRAEAQRAMREVREIVVLGRVPRG